MPDFKKEDIQGLSQQALTQLLQTLQQLEAVSPLDYQPHKKQRQFHLNPKRIRLACGGNRSGKSQAGSAQTAWHVTGIYPDWYPKQLRLYKANRGRIIVQSFSVGASVIQQKLWKWIPKDLVLSIKRNQNGALAKVLVKHKMGGISQIQVMSHQQQDGVFQGWSGHWAWFDQPPPNQKFVGTWRGLTDFGGRCWFTMTPIKEPWVYDQFIDNPDQKLVQYINMSIYDNPTLTPQFIKDYQSQIPQQDKEARLHGKFRHLVGRVYKDLDRSIHCVSGKDIKLDTRWPTYFVLDPADRRPHHGIWFKVDPLGIIWVFDQIVYKGTIQQVSKQILKRQTTNRINPLHVIRILDPNKGQTPSNVTGLRLKDQFAKWAVYFVTHVNDDVALGHLAVMQKLKWDKSKPISSTNRPKLYFIKEGTKQCIRQLMSYVWDDWRGVAKDSKSQKQKPKDINKDMPDCVRYGVMFNPQFYVPQADVDQTPNWNTATGYGH